MSGAPTCVDDLGEQPLALLALRQVGLDRDGRAAGGADALAVSRSEPTYFGSGSIVRAVMRHGRALGRESLGDRLAEAAAGAGHERDLSVTGTRHGVRDYWSTMPAVPSSRRRPTSQKRLAALGVDDVRRSPAARRA